MADPIGFNETARSRFFAKVDTSGDCWEWKSTVARNGYGLFRPGGRQNHVPAHRASWELLAGPIPPGLEIDHLCRNRICVNPDHLEPVSGYENWLRSGNPARLNADKTECPRGHEYTAANTRVYRGKRHCRECSRIRDQRRRATRKVA